MVSKRRSLPLVALLATAMASPVLGQHAAGYNSSPNVKLVAHIPLAGVMKVSDIEVEQELSRPYAYVSRGPAAFLGGNFVYDITDIENPKLLATVIAQPSMQSGGHTFVPTPDGRYAMTIMTSPAHQPIRFWDLKPALDGETPVIKQPIGQWTADSRKSGHMIEIRWPYAFVADYQQGLRILDIRFPHDPVEIGYYDTYNYRMPHEPGGAALGAYGLDVRNADGLIVVADDYSGFWAFRMDGFDKWNGHDWGMPNSSSAQDWDNGPDGAPPVS